MENIEINTGENKIRSVVIALVWHLIEYLLLFFCIPTARVVTRSEILNYILLIVIYALPIAFWIARYRLKKVKKWDALGTKVLIVVGLVQLPVSLISILIDCRAYTWAAYLPWISDTKVGSFFPTSQRGNILSALFLSWLDCLQLFLIIVLVEIAILITKKIIAYVKEV